MTATRKDKDRLNAAPGRVVTVTDKTISAKDIRGAGAVRIEAKGGTIEAVPISFDRFCELEELAEDARSLASIRRTEGEETFPLDVVRRLAAGDNPVRVFRDHRGLNQDALATAVGISRNYLSEIEGNKKPGSVANLRKIADALDVDLDNLA